MADIDDVDVRVAASPLAVTAHDDLKRSGGVNVSPGAPEASTMTGTVFLSFSQVSARVALKHTAIYAGMAAETFPKPVKVGTGSRWVESEIEAWMLERIAERDGSGL